ncbi:MAG: alpha/beta hydrolase [Anaerolineaceae bacterium]|nr:alpha/beta hydrolase [Anaerolineaceae bacterium]
MNKIVLWVIGIIVVLVIVGGIFVWQMMQKPMYNVGQAAEQSFVIPQQSKSNYWTVEPGIDLYYQTQGSGRPVLIIHGGPGMPYDEPIAVLDALGDRYTFYYYDQRGCGDSTHPIDTFDSKNYGENVTKLNQELGMATQLADIERIRLILGEEKLILFGHSFGGLLASLYAAEFPEHVESMVLISPAEMIIMPPPEGGLYESVLPDLPEEMQESYQAYIKDYLNFGNVFKYSEQEMQQRTLTFTSYYEVAMETKGLSIPASNAAESKEIGGWMPFALYFGIGAKNDFTPDLAAVEAPVLIIHGEDDFQTINVSYLYSNAMPNSRVESIANASHFSFADQPEEFIQLLDDFLP